LKTGGGVDIRRVRSMICQVQLVLWYNVKLGTCC